jgi:hypothetical protein
MDSHQGPLLLLAARRARHHASTKRASHLDVSTALVKER